MAQAALRFGCAKQLKNLKRCLVIGIILLDCTYANMAPWDWKLTLKVMFSTFVWLMWMALSKGFVQNWILSKNILPVDPCLQNPTTDVTLLLMYPWMCGTWRLPVHSLEENINYHHQKPTSRISNVSGSAGQKFLTTSFTVGWVNKDLLLFLAKLWRL